MLYYNVLIIYYKYVLKCGYVYLCKIKTIQFFLFLSNSALYLQIGYHW